MTTTFPFSLVNITEPTPYGKTFRLADGQLVRSTHGEHLHGTLRKVQTDLDGLLAILRDARPGQHLTAGVPSIAPGAEAPLSAVSLARPGDLTRTAECLPFPAGPGLMVIDADGVGDHLLVRDQLADACEELGGCAMAITTSSSSNIVRADTGQTMRGAEGLHLMVPVQDATDIPRALQVIHDRLWLEGHGQVRVSDAGRPLLRTVVDLALRNPAQPVFLASHCGPGLEQRRQRWRVAGPILDTRQALPDLTAQERERLQQLQADAVARVADALADARSVWEERQVAQLVARGVKPTEAREHCRQAADSGDLSADWPLILADGRQVTVGDVLADKARFHGMPCRDPLEPDYGGNSVAKLYTHQAKPVVQSHAHGGRSYFLKPYTTAQLEQASELTQRLIASAKAERGPAQAAGAAALKAGPVDIFRATPTPALDAALFPDVVGDYAVMQALAAGHDHGGYLLAMLATCAGALSDDVRIELDARTAWYESARLWVLLLGAPGSAKTPAIRAAMGPLFGLHRELLDQHRRDCEGLADDAERPPEPAVFTNDATVEALSDKLKANPRGLLTVFEELDSWIGGHDAYRGGQGSKDRGEWLRLFDGGPHQVDRVKRGSFFVPNWGVSVLGATTPAGLKRHSSSLPPDGLLQRFLPVFVRSMTAADPSVDALRLKATRDAFEARLREVFSVRSGTVRMTREAAALFAERRDQLRAEVEAAAGLGDGFAAHLAKHAGLLGRVALALHAAQNGSATAEVLLADETMRSAIALLRSLGRHALAMFDLLSTERSSTELARAVAQTILADKMAGLTRNDLLQGCRAFRRASEQERESALLLLVDAAWVTPAEGGRAYAGRAARFVVADEVHARFGAEGDDLRRRRDAVRELFQG